MLDSNLPLLAPPPQDAPHPLSDMLLLPLADSAHPLQDTPRPLLDTLLLPLVDSAHPLLVLEVTHLLLNKDMEDSHLNNQVTLPKEVMRHLREECNCMEDSKPLTLLNGYALAPNKWILSRITI